MKNKLKFNLEEKNQIVFGDSKEWLQFIPNNSIDFIYIDPPFFSNRNYEVIWGNGFELRSFGDRWKGGLNHYVAWMRERLIEAHRVLKPTGSIILHCDHHANHHLRLLLDEIFGADQFINELVWCYKSGGSSSKYFARKHDNLYFYSKSKKYLFNCIKEKSYMKEGSGKNPNQKYYSDENNKSYTLTAPKDWFEVGILATSSKERIGYATQKPEALIKKLIQHCTNENDLVLDFFAGGGDYNESLLRSKQALHNRRCITRCN